MRRKTDSKPHITKEKKEKFAEAVLNSRISEKYSFSYLASYLQREGKLTKDEAMKAVKQRRG